MLRLVRGATAVELYEEATTAFLVDAGLTNPDTGRVAVAAASRRALRCLVIFAMM